MPDRAYDPEIAPIVPLTEVIVLTTHSRTFGRGSLSLKHLTAVSGP